MDSITQAVLGAAVGEAILGKHLGNRALVWGAVLGTLPDLDVVFSPFLDTASRLVHHRGASHSLLVMVAASFVLGPLLAKVWKRHEVSNARAGWFVFLVWSTHVLIDCFTVYGTTVFWPFSDYRAGFNNLFIIDPFYTGPLLVSLVWLAFLRSPENQLKRRRVCFWGLGLSSAYVCLSLIAKAVSSGGFKADLERRGVDYVRRMESPTPFNILLWRAVVDRGDEFWVGYRTVFESRSTPVRWTIYPRGRDAFERFADTREVRTIDWFSDGWWIARPHEEGLWIGDLRFDEARDWSDHQGTINNRPAFSWLFTPYSESDRLRQIEADDHQIQETLRRLVLRIVGRKSEWQAAPRLAGVDGTPPATLRVEE